MAIRKQVMLQDETWKTLRALAYVTSRPLDGAVQEALALAFKADPELAAKVAEATRLAA